MKVLSYLFSLFCLYLTVQAWSFLWDIHFLLPIGIVALILAVGIVFLVTAEDRKKARSDRIFEEMCDQYDLEQRLRDE
ncbi:hypothetical protein N9X77_04110 [Luminiphilus sp.]|nr:hypothetical protein [Luminiphilus sp.]